MVNAPPQLLEALVRSCLLASTNCGALFYCIKLSQACTELLSSITAQPADFPVDGLLPDLTTISAEGPSSQMSHQPPDLPSPGGCIPLRSAPHCIEYAHLILWGQVRQGEEFDTDNDEHMKWVIRHLGGQAVR